MENQTNEKNLTNEKLKEKFESPFELVGYAITLVGNMVHSGRAPRIKTTVENPAVWALEEILQGKDILETIPEDAPLIETVAQTFAATTLEMDTLKPIEKKKPRRILH